MVNPRKNGAFKTAAQRVKTHATFLEVPMPCSRRRHTAQLISRRCVLSVDKHRSRRLRSLVCSMFRFAWCLKNACQRLPWEVWVSSATSHHNPFPSEAFLGHTRNLRECPLCHKMLKSSSVQLHADTHHEACTIRQRETTGEPQMKQAHALSHDPFAFLVPSTTNADGTV